MQERINAFTQLCPWDFALLVFFSDKLLFIKQKMRLGTYPRSNIQYKRWLLHIHYKPLPHPPPPTHTFFFLLLFFLKIIHSLWLVDYIPTYYSQYTIDKAHYYLPECVRERRGRANPHTEINSENSCNLLPVESHHRTSEEEYPSHYPVVCHTWTGLSSSDMWLSFAETYKQLKKR